MLVLAMEFSGARRHIDRRRSLATEKEQLGPTHSERQEAAGSSAPESSRSGLNTYDHQPDDIGTNNQ